MSLLKSLNLLLAFYCEMLLLESCLLANVNPITNDYPHQHLSKNYFDEVNLENDDSDSLASKNVENIESQLNLEVSNSHLNKKLKGQLGESSHFEIEASNSKKYDYDHYAEAKEKNEPFNYVSHINEKSQNTIEKSPKRNKGEDKQFNYQTSKYNDPNLLFLYQSKCQRLYKGPECKNLPIINSDGASIIDLKENKETATLLDAPLKDFSSGKVIKEKFNPENNEKSGSKENIEDIEYVPHLPDCNKKLERFPILVISTLDGFISGINYRTGEVIWSHETSANGNPLLSSSMSKLEVSSRGKWVRLIPSLDGGIYRFDGTNVEPLPISADMLLQSSFKFNEDTIFSGGKFNEILGLHPQTGKVIYVCNWDGCPHNTHAETQSDQVLIIKRISQTVRAIDPKTGNERWHFAVGKHELNVAISDCESLRENEEDVKSTLPSFHFVLPEGLVAATDEHSQILWQQKLSSPIVSAWSLINGRLESINLFKGTSVPALSPGSIPEEPETQGALPGYYSQQHFPTLYVGIHKQQLYIQQNLLSGPGKSTLSNFIQPPHRGASKDKKVYWRSYLSAPYFQLLLVSHNHNLPPLLDYDAEKEAVVGTDLAIRHHFDTLIDHGYYMFGDSDDNDYLEMNEFWNSTEEMPLVDEDSPLIDQIFFYCFEIGPSFWWKLSTGACIYGFLHWLLVRYLVSRLVGNLRDRISERVRVLTLIILQNILAEHPQVLSIIQRMGLGTLPLPPPPPSLSRTESELTPSFENEPQRQDSNFSSRLSSDFEPMQRLGKGGFGVVFHVKNKLDQNEYAIKRIILPSKESSAERVKREVRALAKLNHPNIVRYYNSWMETPPEGWEKEADSLWINSDALSQSLLTSPDVEDSDSNPPADVDPLPNEKDSLSGIVNRLHHYLSQEKSSGCNLYEDNIINNDSSEDSDSSDGEGEEAYSNNYQADCKMDDNSFEICFEDQAGQEVKDSNERQPNDRICDSNCEPCHIVSNEILTGSDFSRLTCQTRSSLSKAPPTFNSESHLREPREKSSSLSSCSPPQTKLLLRRRATSLISCQDDHKKPDSLHLFTSSEDKVALDRNANRGKNICKTNAQLPNLRTYLYIQMELCLKESLKDWLLANQTRDTQQLYSMFNDIVHAVEYVHDRSLMHRDLKPSNIFFSLDGEIKIGDFGLVTTIDADDPLTPVDDQLEPPISSEQQRTLNAGTHLYMSPEQQMSGHSYTYKVDIFSLGLIFFEMLVPFSTEMERREVMLKARKMIFPPEFSITYPHVAKLLEFSLHGDPNERPTTRGIRVREPLVSLQKDLDSISPEEHFRLTRIKGHARSSSGSVSSSFSASSF